MSNEKVRVKRKAIAACVTCPICKQMLQDATTISECLHTFCRKCIYSRLSDGNLGCCPICNTYLGCVPEEKLRSDDPSLSLLCLCRVQFVGVGPDHNLQQLRTQIFPSEKRKPDPPEAVSSARLPGRRKERPLSSFIVSTPTALLKKTALTEVSLAEELKNVAVKRSVEYKDLPGVYPEDPIPYQGDDGARPPHRKLTDPQGPEGWSMHDMRAYEGFFGDGPIPEDAYNAFGIPSDIDYLRNRSTSDLYNIWSATQGQAITCMKVMYGISLFKDGLIRDYQKDNKKALKENEALKNQGVTEALKAAVRIQSLEKELAAKEDLLKAENEKVASRDESIRELKSAMEYLDKRFSEFRERAQGELFGWAREKRLLKAGTARLAVEVISEKARSSDPKVNKAVIDANLNSPEFTKEWASRLKAMYD